MTDTKYKVVLSVDGNHSVSVESDDPAGTTAGLVWATDTYQKLVRLGRADQKKLSEPLREELQEDAEPDEAPLCALHHLPMVWQRGRKGYFWSCHEKNTDGSWCSYRPI